MEAFTLFMKLAMEHPNTALLMILAVTLLFGSGATIVIGSHNKINTKGAKKRRNTTNMWTFILLALSITTFGISIDRIIEINQITIVVGRPFENNDQTTTPSPATTPMLSVPSISAYVGVLSVDASAYYISSSNPQKNEYYKPSGILDDDIRTAWLVAAKRGHPGKVLPDEPIGQWISLSVENGKQYQIAGFRMINGFHLQNNDFKQNARITALNVSSDGGEAELVPIEDTPDSFVYKLIKPLNGTAFTFTIKDFTGGSDYDDCAIAKLELLGIDEI